MFRLSVLLVSLLLVEAVSVFARGARCSSCNMLVGGAS
jgi:hypothetical protein